MRYLNVLYANGEKYSFSVLKKNNFMICLFFSQKECLTGTSPSHTKKYNRQSFGSKNPCFPLKGLTVNNIQKYPLKI